MTAGKICQRGIRMVNEKHLFLIVGVLVIGMIGFMVYDSGNRAKQISGEGMPIDESIPINTGNPPAGSGQVQVVSLHASAYGYDKNSISVKAGEPVRLDFSADSNAGCGRQLIVDNVGVNVVSRNGEVVSATFTPPSPGQYRFHCAMNMFRGVLIAT
mgnify:CR=1 FL=1